MTHRPMFYSNHMLILALIANYADRCRLRLFKPINSWREMEYSLMMMKMRCHRK